MSNKSRLQTNNTNLQALIDKANSLPDAGSGGSGGVETYNLIFQSNGTVKLSYIRYVSYENGEYHFYDDIVDSSSTYPIVFSNVVLCSPVLYNYYGGPVPWIELISKINYVKPTTSTGYSEEIYSGILPLSTDNGQVVLRLFNDD